MLSQCGVCCAPLQWDWEELPCQIEEHLQEETHAKFSL